MYAPKAVETLKKMNSMSVDREIPILHHYIFYHVNRKYSYNVDYIDNPDGAITGHLFGLDKHDYVISREGFRIEPNGDINKGIMRNFALKVKILKETK